MMGKARSTAPIRAPRQAHRRALGYRAQQVLKLLAERSTNVTYDEIADELGFSDRSRVAHCIAGLERSGYLRRMGHAHRGQSRVIVLCLTATFPGL